MRLLVKITFLFLAIGLLSFSSLAAQSNVSIFSENFSSASAAILNVPVIGSDFGTNQWVISSDYAGDTTHPTTTSQTQTNGGFSISGPNGNYLHIADSTALPTVGCASYERSVASERWAIIDEVICTKSFSNVRLRFAWLCEGDSNDYGEVFFRANGGTWTKTGKTKYNSVASNQWTQETISDPAFENLSSLEFAFRWKNTTGSAPNRISFAVDDVEVLGDMDTTSNGVQINITSVPDSTCKGFNMIFGFQITDTLCDGQYTIDLINPSNNVVAGWVFNISNPQTSGFLSINLGSNLATGNCYRLRVNRTSPAPQLIGNVSNCFKVYSCPSAISTLQPAVTKLATTPDSGLCVGSVIDVPFWSYGSYTSGNLYEAELSDSSGSFANAQVIGNLGSVTAFDPQLVPNPGLIEGTIPQTAAGCNYFVRVIADKPPTIGAALGPFCIKDCDILTNNGQDIQVCLKQTVGDTIMIPFTINNGGNPVSYCSSPNNTMNVEVLNFNSFVPLNTAGTIGAKVTSNSDSIQVIFPGSNGLGAIGMASGHAYLRVSGTCGNPSNNLQGTLVHLTIGAPKDSLNIVPKPKFLCQGDVSILTVGPPGTHNSQSNYQWYLNGSKFGPNPNNSPTYPLGVVFNGAIGPYEFEVQEDNFGCMGPMSNPDTVWVLGSNAPSISGENKICFPDTVTYSVGGPFDSVFTSNLSGGQIISSSKKSITIAWDTTNNSSDTIFAKANYAPCGGGGLVSKVIKSTPKVSVDAGKDTTIFIGDTVQIGGNPTASSGSPPYTYAWDPINEIDNKSASNPNVWPSNNRIYTAVVTDVHGCKSADKMVVTVSFVNIEKELSTTPLATVYPNPVTTHTVLQFHYDSFSEISIGVLDLVGNTIQATKHRVLIGDNKIEVDTGTLSPGYYLLQISGEGHHFQLPFLKR